MNPYWKEKWLQALRSGEYEQGVDKLLDQGKYCCLGVLCDIVADEDSKVEWSDNMFIIAPDEDTDDYEYCEELLHPYVRDIAELEDDNPLIELEGNRKTLTYLNDKKRFTFKEIADIIEEQL